jgi:KUP system potassium uptake protein
VIAQGTQNIRDIAFFFFILMNFSFNCIVGGTFALYSLLCRHFNIGILPSKQVGMNSTRVTETNTWLAKLFETSIVARRLLLFIAMLGTCMLIGDGILTPAISGL